ncbi:(2Fe-2S)-binding protein [Dactylosporangium sp. CA-092794]|uniref:(2Fe-2S)-binding protein n=1 Tax=Dactylosporangium sp. CA-092794 TaxID=3239929 RepID=UPI003D8AD979
MSAETELSLEVNGTSHRVRASADDTLLDVLRRELRLFSCRETCGIGLCGSCTVICDGKAVSACLALALAVADSRITTAEGLARGDQLHPVQQAFVDAQAFQCSFCTPGFIMSVVAMLAEPPRQRSVEAALSGHLCRCGSYGQIAEAVRRLVGTDDAEQEE